MDPASFIAAIPTLAALGEMPLNKLLSPAFLTSESGVALLATTLIGLTLLKTVKTAVFPPLNFAEDYVIDTSPIPKFKNVGKKSGIDRKLEDIPGLVR